MGKYYIINNTSILLHYHSLIVYFVGLPIWSFHDDLSTCLFSVYQSEKRVKFSENIACRGNIAASVIITLKGPDRSYTTVAP